MYNDIKEEVKKMEYEIIVVGGGHAGCEAALASARMNKKNTYDNYE